MAGHSEFEARVKRISRRAARTPAGRAAAMRQRRGRHLHGTLGVPISALVGLLAGWGGMVAAQFWLRPGWDAEALVLPAGLEPGTLTLGLGSIVAVLAVVLLGFTRFWHVSVAAACSVAAFHAAPYLVQYWPEVAEAPPPGWMVAAFTA